jgi:RNA recognition motif-containing protein
MESTGYRAGGPKEARLHRVALLSKVKEIDHLHPVKVHDIPQTASPEKLREAFSEFGEVGDVYIPADYKERRPKQGFAIVRYTSPDALDRLMENSSPLHSPSSSNKSVSSFHSSGTISVISRPMTSEGKPVAIDGKTVSVGPLEKQRSFFTRGTGYLGICNEPVEDGTYNRDPVLVQQDISLSSCLSRSGYPWGSVRELKYLAPHLPKPAYESFTMKIENLDRQTT